MPYIFSGKMRKKQLVVCDLITNKVYFQSSANASQKEPETPEEPPLKVTKLVSIGNVNLYENEDAILGLPF